MSSEISGVPLANAFALFDQRVSECRSLCAHLPRPHVLAEESSRARRLEGVQGAVVGRTPRAVKNAVHLLQAFATVPQQQKPKIQNGAYAPFCLNQLPPSHRL
jgi:hypothetical protein